MTAGIDEAVGAALSGVRLDRAVALAADVSRAAAARLVDAGAVRIDGAVVTYRARRLSAGERLAVDLAEADPAPGAGAAAPRADGSVAFETVHCDADVAVVDKPAGLVVHPGPGHPRATLVNGLLARFPEMAGVGDPLRPGIVHRLDRDTSGLLAAARSARAYDSLTAQLKARRPRRVYSALVWGHPSADAGVIEAPIGRSSRNPTRMAVTERGRPAVTRYRVKGRYDAPSPVAWLNCRLETGRTHQIRVHLRAIGHPVVGDRVYAGPGAVQGGLGDALGLTRPFLHARELRFRHPATGRPVSYNAALPVDLAAALRTCRAS